MNPTVKEFALNFIAGNGKIKIIKRSKIIFNGNMENLLYGTDKEILNHVVDGIKAEDNYIVVECK